MDLVRVLPWVNSSSDRSSKFIKTSSLGLKYCLIFQHHLLTIGYCHIRIKQCLMAGQWRRKLFNDSSFYQGCKSLPRYRVFCALATDSEVSLILGSSKKSLIEKASIQKNWIFQTWEMRDPCIHSNFIFSNVKVYLKKNFGHNLLTCKTEGLLSRNLTKNGLIV